MTAPRPGSRRGLNLDPTGKRALFEAPVAAADDAIRSGTDRSGRDALFSTGPAEPGTVLVECSACHARSRLGLGAVAVRIAAFSLYLPLLHPRHPHRIACPACEQVAWCRIGWRE